MLARNCVQALILSFAAGEAPRSHHKRDTSAAVVGFIPT
jgi:hypothetical protein